MNELPQGWVATTLGDLGRWSSGGTPSKRKPEYYGGDIPWVRTGDLRDNEIHDVEGRISPEGLANSSAKEFPSETLLVAMYGATIGRTGMLRIPATTNQACAALLPDPVTEDMMPFLWWFFRHKVEDFRAVGQGGAQPNISQTVIKASAIDLPPLPEQRRIVAKLDRLSARSAAARDHLARTTKLATRAKQAILKNAFAGLLTEGWRATRMVPTVATDREGIDGRVPELGDIPTAWGWRAVGTVSEVSGGLTKNRARADMHLKAPYLRVANVYANELRLDEVAEIGCTKADIQRTLLQAGDLLVVEGNGSRDQIGRVAVWTGEVDGCLHQNHLIRVRPEPSTSSAFLLYWMLSPNGRTAIETVASSSSGLHTLSLSKVKGMPVPLCSEKEQDEIVRRIEAAFARINRMTEETSRAAHLLDRLDERLLAEAFRGELVPQDPNDEPAEALLARIREARAAAPTAKRGRRKKAEA